MKPYNYNNKVYGDEEAVPWNIAIEVGGFYFSRAKHLGLPEPPACFVFDNGSNDPKTLTIIGRYHEMFREAEADIITKARLGEIGKIGGSRSSEKKTIAVRENAKKGGYPKGRPRKPKI
jgi:hypothetical protein